MDNEMLRRQIETLHTRYIQSIDEDRLEETPHRNPAGDPALNLKYFSLAMIGAAAIFTVLHAQESATRSVWDGVYTDQQAKRGEPKYRENCADCHGDDLEGDAEAPALSGATFQTNWEGLPLGSLFQRIRRDMPLNKY